MGVRGVLVAHSSFFSLSTAAMSMRAAVHWLVTFRRQSALHDQSSFLATSARSVADIVVVRQSLKWHFSHQADNYFGCNVFNVTHHSLRTVRTLQMNDGNIMT